MLDVDQNYGEPDTPKPLPTFKDYVAQDVETVFFNLNEFAEERYIDDKQKPIGGSEDASGGSTGNQRGGSSNSYQRTYTSSSGNTYNLRLKRK